MKRGRPKHDDVLTLREWQVLALLRDGLSNEEIAGRLEISTATAKFHVSEILSKLGLSNRQEAARWPGAPRRLPALLLPFAPATWRSRRVAIMAASALVACLLVATFLLLPSAPRRSAGEDATAHVAVDSLGASIETVGPLPAGELPLTVCFSDETWQKPSPAQQERYMTTDYRPIRYGVGQGLSGRIQDAYQAHFWSFGFSLSGQFSMTDMSGLWTAQEAGVDLSHTWLGPCEGTLDSSIAVFNIWLLGYRGESAHLDDSGTLTIRVQAKSAGFEGVQVRVPGGPICCPPMRYEHTGPYAPVKRIDFVDQAGSLVETLQDGIWSHP